MKCTHKDAKRPNRHATVHAGDRQNSPPPPFQSTHSYFRHSPSKRGNLVSQSTADCEQQVRGLLRKAGTQHSSKSDSWLEGKRGQLWKEQTQLKKQAIGNQAAKGGLDFLCPVVPEVGLFILHWGNCFLKEKTFPVHASIQGEKYEVSPLVDR